MCIYNYKTKSIIFNKAQIESCITALKVEENEFVSVYQEKEKKRTIYLFY